MKNFSSTQLRKTSNDVYNAVTREGSAHISHRDRSDMVLVDRAQVVSALAVIDAVPSGRDLFDSNTSFVAYHNAIGRIHELFVLDTDYENEHDLTLKASEV